MIDISIIIAVYNHEKYIERAIKSVLDQQISFSYEVLIGEDCSTDNSRKILEGMESTLPKEYKIYYRERNYGAVENFRDLYNRSNGKYIIVLEGDDYWNYNKKLYKQFQFLETHNDYIAVAHNTIIVDSDDNTMDLDYSECKNNIYTMKDFFDGKLPGQTTTILMKNIYVNNSIDVDLDVGNYPGDRRIAFLLAYNGKVKCIQESWSSYRFITSGGSSFSATNKHSRKDSLVFWKALYDYTKRNDGEDWIKMEIEKRYFYYYLSILTDDTNNKLRQECKKDIKEFKYKGKIYLGAILYYFSLKKRRRK